MQFEMEVGHQESQCPESVAGLRMSSGILRKRVEVGWYAALLALATVL